MGLLPVTSSTCSELCGTSCLWKHGLCKVSTQETIAQVLCCCSTQWLCRNDEKSQGSGKGTWRFWKAAPSLKRSAGIITIQINTGHSVPGKYIWNVAKSIWNVMLFLQRLIEASTWNQSCEQPGQLEDYLLGGCRDQSLRAPVWQWQLAGIQTGNVRSWVVKFLHSPFFVILTLPSSKLQCLWNGFGIHGLRLNLAKAGARWISGEFQCLSCRDEAAERCSLGHCLITLFIQTHPFGIQTDAT